MTLQEINTPKNIGLNSQNRYEIKVYGQLDDPWLGLFGTTKIQVEILADNNQVTTFSDVVTDQAGLVSRDLSPRPSGSQAFCEAWLRVYPAPEHCLAYVVAFFPKAQKEKSQYL